jgi:hypothetical protein
MAAIEANASLAGCIASFLSANFSLGAIKER